MGLRDGGEGAIGETHQRLVQTMFLLVPSLFIVLIIATGNSALLQTPADYLFRGYIQNAELRLYLFDALLFVPFFILAFWSIRGIETHGRHVGEVLSE